MPRLISVLHNLIGHQGGDYLRLWHPSLTLPRMPDIEYVGAVVTLERLSGNREPHDLSLRYFARLASGVDVFDPEPKSRTMGLGNLDFLADRIVRYVHAHQFGHEGRRLPWTRLAGELASYGIITDAESLFVLPFVVSTQGLVLDMRVDEV